MRETTARPSPCDALLGALGDSYESRRLINEFAHHLALAAKDVEDNPGAPWAPSQIIDPFQHTRETWAAVTRCPRMATPIPPAQLVPDDLPGCRGTDGRTCPGPRICDHADCLEGYDRAIVAPSDAPTCAHCGEPFAADSAVTTTPGGSQKPDHLWHLGRAACAEAAYSHRALIQKTGHIVPPAPSDPGSST